MPFLRTPDACCSTPPSVSAGLMDPATAAGLEKNEPRFGQTLGKWGARTGPYL